MNPKDVLTCLHQYFNLKQDSIRSPDDYLGTKIKLTTLPNGVQAWGQSSSHYIWNAINNLESWMKDKSYQLPRKAPIPMVTGYQPELDVSGVLNAEMTNY